MRTEIYEANQDAYEELFDAISAELTQETITRLNAEVEIDGVPVEIVAERFLTDSGII
jgi:glycine betaine/choline ABC-type transport system substrate-binding protein